MSSQSSKRPWLAEEREQEPWPTLKEARAAGCTCVWWGGGAILKPDPERPILDQHKGAAWQARPLPSESE